ncbi:MAG: SMC-Scp complex subunit ScpB [Candidatus Hodarchaeota archaeon]
MEENPDKENNEEIEENPDNIFDEEENELLDEEIKDVETLTEIESKEVDLDDSMKEIEGEFIEQLETKSEDIEKLELVEEFDQESEAILIEESIDVQRLEDANNIIKNTSESTIIHEKALELDEKALHRNFIEAALYAAGGPLTIEELSNKLEFPKKEVETLVNELAFDYLERTTSLIIAQIGDRYQMQIRPEYTEKVSKFAKGGAIAERHLRTLTIIALKQPILKSMVIKLRGTGAYEHIKYLLDNEFINAVKKGRSHELTTSDKYAEMFGLPKDIRLMKQAMINQLGIGEGGEIKVSGETEEVEKVEDSIEIEEENQVEPMNENDEVEE